jgi:hypothetical protein
MGTKNNKLVVTHFIEIVGLPCSKYAYKKHKLKNKIYRSWTDRVLRYVRNGNHVYFCCLIWLQPQPPHPSACIYTGNTKRRNTQCEVRRSWSQIRQQLKKARP